MVKVLLNSGLEIELDKDCECLTHDGPHWLHVDSLWRATNKSMLENGNHLGFITAENARVNEKIGNLKRLDIKQIL